MDIVLILVLVVALAYWWDTTRSNELALRHCGNLCQRSAVQLLDSSIARQRVWLRRTDSGLQICRLYSFEFSGDNQSRQQGYIVLLGFHVAESHMEPWRVNEF